MTRLASLALLLACSLPALGQGLILGAPAQGASGGGGGSGVVETITETGSGLTVDSTDPANPVLSLGAVLEAIANLSGTDNQLVRMDGTGDLQASDATISDAELLDLTVTGALSLGTGTNDVRLEKGTTNRWHLRSGDDDEWAGLVLNLLAAGDSTLDVEAVLSATSLTAANTRFISLTDSGAPSLRAYAASATAGNGNYLGFARFGGTLASPTAVTAGDTILAIYGRQAATASITGDLEAAAITMETDGAVGAGDSPGRIAFWTNGDGAGNTATKRWTLNNAGHWLAFADNSYDIGASGATRPRVLYAGTRFQIPAGSASAAGVGLSATTGMFGVDATSLSLTINNTEEQRLTATALDRGPDQVVFGASIGSPDVGLVRDAAGRVRVSDASTGLGDVRVDEAIFTTSDASGFRLSAVSSTAFRLLDGDGTDVDVGDSFGVGTTTGFPLLDAAAGNASFPSFAFIGDANTGMYRIGADNLGFATGGTLALEITSGQDVRAAAGLVIGAASDSGWRLVDSGSSLLVQDGDLSALEANDAFVWGGTNGWPSLRAATNDPSSGTFTFVGDPNTGLSEIELDAPAIHAEGKWREIHSNAITVADGAATTVLTCSLNSGEMVTFCFEFHIHATGDGSTMDTLVQFATVTVYDSGGSLTSDTDLGTGSVSSAWTGFAVTVADGGTNLINVQVNANSDLTNPVITCRYSLSMAHSGATTVTIP